jgi:bla regulator protein blaR1
MTTWAHLPASALTHALGWTLLHFLWQGAMIALLLGATLCLVPSRASWLRYALACAAMALMAAFPLATFGVLAGVPPSTRILLAPPYGQAGESPAPGIGSLPEPWRMRMERALNRSLPMVTGVWLAGVLVLLGRLNLGLLAARRIKVSSVQPALEATRNLLGTLRIKLGIERTVLLLDSARVQAPTVIGWLEPAILLPLGCMAGLSRVQVEAILIHELAHIRRHDYLVGLLQSMAEMVLFYHPAVWWVSTQIRREREHCCDDLAVEVSGDRLAYARALSLLEERRSPIPAGAFGATGGVLKKRIARLLGFEPPPIFPPAAALLLLLACAVAGVAAARAVAQAAPAQSSSPATPHEDAYFARWVSQDVLWIITPAEKSAFLGLRTDAERRAFIGQFWDRHNPAPGSRENRFKDEHYRRIGYANLHFATRAKPGWNSDRGHIYIVYGPPDSIDAFPRGDSATKPRETWHYRSIRVDVARNAGPDQGATPHEREIKNDVDFSFVDACACGEYQLKPPPAVYGGAPAGR